MLQIFFAIIKKKIVLQNNSEPPSIIMSLSRTARDIIFQANDYGKRRFEYWILVEFGYDSSQNLSKPQFTTGCQIQYTPYCTTFHFLCSNLVYISILLPYSFITFSIWIDVVICKCISIVRIKFYCKECKI